MTSYVSNLFSSIARPLRRRITDFGNWLVNTVNPSDIPQVLDDFRLHVRRSVVPSMPDVRAPTQSRIRLRARPSARVPLAPRPPPVKERFNISQKRSAFRGYTRVHKIDGKRGYLPEEFFNETTEPIRGILGSNLQKKVKIVLKSRYYYVTDENMEEREFAFHSSQYLNLNRADVNDILRDALDEINAKMDKFEREGSGWAFVSITSLEIYTVVYEPLGADGWIDLPDWIKNKKAVINPKNKDNKCFLWCVLESVKS